MWLSMLLKIITGGDYSTYSPKEQTAMIRNIDISPSQTEALIKVSASAKKRAEMVVNKVLVEKLSRTTSDEQEWKIVDNYMRGIDPDSILDKSNIRVWWQCNKHSKRKIYPMTIRNKVLMQKRHKISCPYCKGYRIARHIIG